MCSYQVDNYLHYKSSHVAAACIYVAQQTMQLTIPPENGWEWWEMMPFQIPLETLTGSLACPEGKTPDKGILEFQSLHKA